VAETYVQLPSDVANTGKLEDHFSVTGGNLREAIVVGDPVSNTAVATVTAAHGLQVEVTQTDGTVAGTVADGANVTQGAIADVAVTGDVNGTISAKLRGISKMLALAFSVANNWFAVSIQNALLTVTVVPAASGGCSNYHAVSLGSTNAANIKATPGQVYGVHVYNNASYPVYVKLYNVAGAPTVGTSTVVKTIGVQAGTSRDVLIPLGEAFATGIGVSITKGIADNDATAVLASDCVIDIEWL
jgi:hypothetical protein